MTEHELKPDDLTPDKIQELLDDGTISVKSDHGKLRLLSKWKFENKIYWICKIADKDYSIFDGMGVLDCTFDSISVAEESMRNSGATRVIKI